MGVRAKRIGIKILVFVAAAICTAFTFVVAAEVGPSVFIGLQKSSGIILGFLLIFIISWFGLSRLRDASGIRAVLLLISVVLLLQIIVNTTLMKVSFSIKMSVLYLSWILGLLAGYLYWKQGKLTQPVIMAAFPLVMGLGMFDLWAYRFDFGTWSGQVENNHTAQFEFTNKDGENVINEDLNGHVVVLDFWFMGCPPCWKAFPELQKVFDEYGSNPQVRLYAINRGDDPEVLFNWIENRGFTFPVLRGEKETIDKLGVSVFPTTMLLNRKGEIVFRGNLEDAVVELGKLLERQ